MWVPVTVEDDDGVSRLQVEPQASCPGTEQEHKVLTGWVIECLQQHAAVLCLGGTYRKKTVLKCESQSLYMVSENPTLTYKPATVLAKC